MSDTSSTQPESSNTVVENRSPDRCRLVLLADASAFANQPDAVGLLDGCLSAGDVASLILVAGKLDEAVFQTVAKPLVACAQKHGVAAIVENHSRVAGRIGADGLQLGQDPDALADAMAKFHPGMMVGASNVKTRHNALVLGELQPDYLMFGKAGGDTHDAAHPKNLSLGEWWAAMVEIPCIVMGGSAIESVVNVARTGAEFVALDTAIFAPQGDVIDMRQAADRIRQANDLLDENAPAFDA